MTVNRKLCIYTENGVYSEGNTNRSILTVGWESVNRKTAVAIGINPSKANDTRSDNTLTRLGRFLAANGYKNFKMLNIFESYSTKQSGIKRTTLTDFSVYERELMAADSIFIVWGMTRSYREERTAILSILKRYEEKVFCLERNGRFPLHPSRMSYESNIISFKID